MMLGWSCWFAGLTIAVGLRAAALGDPRASVAAGRRTAYSPESGRPRGEFSRACQAYPDRRVVLVTVNYNYLDFFRNWLHYAKKHLQDTEQLVVMPEDSAARRALEAMREGGETTFVVADPGAEVLGAGDGAKSSEESQASSAYEYGTKAYGNLVWHRPTYILKLLRGGCSVLYVDIDAVWVSDPFLELGRKPGHDLYLVSDDDAKGNIQKGYLCTCFMYMQPAKPVRQLISAWSQSRNGRANKNQFVFNGVLRALKDTVDLAVLPIDKFPPGVSLHRYPNASIVHANWVHGHSAKVCVMKRRGLWMEGLEQDHGACEEEGKAET